MKLMGSRNRASRLTTVVRLMRNGGAKWSGTSAVSLLAMALLTGCAHSAPLRNRNGVAAESDRDALRCVHVVSEEHLLAGFAWASDEYVTAQRQLQPFLVAVVDGYPMVAKGSLPNARSPWVVLTGRGYRTTPNAVDPDHEVAPGEAVVLGGFVRPEHGMTPFEYLDVPQSVVCGRVLEQQTDSEEPPCRYSVLVPEGEYGGFIGGPAAYRDTHGRLHVWGVIVGWKRLIQASTAGCQIEVARLESRAAKGDLLAPATLPAK